MTADLKSTVGADATIHSISWLRGPFDPIPTNIEQGLTHRQIIDRIAPAGEPVITDRKDRLNYFVPCALQSAELVGKTRDKSIAAGQKTIGVMRSSGHVAPSSWLAFDLDGLTSEQFEHIRDNLDSAGVTCLAYSTFSHGARPGEFRVRVVVFLDRAVPPVEWSGCWRVLNELLLCGLADPQTGKLAQQAGVWAVHPERLEHAFRFYKTGALISADTLLALVPKKPEPRPRALRKVPTGQQVDRYTNALEMLDAGEYSQWMLGLGGLRGAVVVGDLTDDEGAALWFQFSDSGGAETQEHNADGRYSPENLWTWTPTAAPAPAMVGRLFGAARDAALSKCKADHKAQGRLTDDGLRAAWYLATYHHKAFVELETEVQS